MSLTPLKVASPTETLEITSSLSLVPRIKLLLTIHRADLSVAPIDEWQFKRSLLDFLKSSHSIPEEDIVLHRFKDMKKRKREDPVANGVLYIRDLEPLSRNKFNKKPTTQEEEEHVLAWEERFLEWRDSFVVKLDGIQLSLKGVKFKLSVEVPQCDDFTRVKQSWEDFYDGAGTIARGGRQLQPDTLVISGLPSRWFAEPRVSSKPSMLVTHTIFSVFGKIRNLNVASDDDLSESVEEGSNIVSGLQCKIVVQFEKHDDFSNTLKLLCGRSMQKHGSRLRADYEATWDRSNFFQNTLQRTRNQIPERNHRESGVTRQYENETPRFQAGSTRFDSRGMHSKRFKE